MSLFFQTALAKLIGLLLLAHLHTSALAQDRPLDSPPLLQFKPIPTFTRDMTTFVCKHEDRETIPLDPEADQWYAKAIELENYSADDDHRANAEMVRLMRKAVERKHWKAMVALSRMYHQGRERTLPDGRPAAVQLMEQAMRLGVPAAF
jgi:TPR repeat protein